MSEQFVRYGHLENPKLVIWLESATVSPRGEALLVWHLRRLSLQTQAVAVDYDCNYVRNGGNGQTYLIMGKQICKPLTGATFSKSKYMRLIGRDTFISHGIGYALVNPAENHEINRCICLAAKCAGLNPVVDLTIPIFQHFIIK